MSVRFTISNWLLAMNYRLAIGDFAAPVFNSKSLIVKALRIGNRKLLIFRTERI